MSSPTRFVLFSDGSSIRNPGGPGGTGFVCYDRQEQSFHFGANRYLRDGEYAVTNNRMELRAVLEALQHVPDGASVELVSDSQYVLNALSKWIHGWRKKGWKTAEGKPVLNRDLIESLDAKLRALEVKYTWVRGHNGHGMNEVCDALAQGAARGQSLPSRDHIASALARSASAR